MAAYFWPGRAKQKVKEAELARTTFQGATGGASGPVHFLPRLSSNLPCTHCVPTSWVVTKILKIFSVKLPRNPLNADVEKNSRITGPSPVALV